MSKKIVNLAIVGSGVWAKNYIHSFESISSGQLRYISSPHIETKTFIPSGIRKIPDYRQLITFPDIDGIIIASSSETHTDITSFFLKNGYPVLVEKPVAMSYSKILTLKKLYKKNHHVFVPGHVYCFHPAFLSFKKSLHQIGQLSSLHLQSGKQKTRNNHISVIWEWGPHDVSMCLEIMKVMPVAVSAWITQNNDFVCARLLYQSNIQA